jgi:hypothetical protein
MSTTLPNSFARQDPDAAGFTGWRTWQELRASGFSEIPRVAGTYVVYRPSAGPPLFIAEGNGRTLQGPLPERPDHDPPGQVGPPAPTPFTWGKSDKLTRTPSSAPGDPKAAHWGRRYIWQLTDADGLLVAWRDLGENFETARLNEIARLAHFADLHDGRRPFADLTG